METSASLRCNVCDENLSREQVEAHVLSRNHAIRKKVAEFNEMNALVGKSYGKDDTSILRIWIRDLYLKDPISQNSTTQA